MHANELVELASLVAMHGSTIVHGLDQIAPRGVQRYWASSRCRLDRWAAVLKSSREHRNSWDDTRGVLQEILAGETLTRVWTAICVAHDRTHDANELEPIARSVYIGHLEARNRALSLMVCGHGMGIEDAVILNQLRRRCERWTDLLLGFLMQHDDVGEFAFDKKRCADFAADLRREYRQSASLTASQLVLASIRTGLRKATASSPNGDLNEQIAAGILSCFHANLFDSIGLLQSLWMLRLNTTTTDAMGMIDDFLAVDETSVHETRPSAQSAAPRFSPRANL